jgi:hypothetical protein
MMGSLAYGSAALPVVVCRHPSGITIVVPLLTVPRLPKPEEPAIGEVPSFSLRSKSAASEALPEWGRALRGRF